MRLIYIYSYTKGVTYLSDKPSFIPRPLVRTNQWVIVLSVIITLTTSFYWILLLPLLSGLSGLFFRFQPILKTARLFLRQPLETYIPEDPAEQRFNQTIAVSLLTISFISFLSGWKTVAVIAAAVVGAAALIAILGFCIGCFIHYQWSQYRYHHLQAKK